MQMQPGVPGVKYAEYISLPNGNQTITGKGRLKFFIDHNISSGLWTVLVISRDGLPFPVNSNIAYISPQKVQTVDIDFHESIVIKPNHNGGIAAYVEYY